MRYVLSVEGLDVPARAAILKSLQSRLGLVTLPDHERCEAPLALLLHRLRSLSRIPDSSNALWAGSWLLAAPTDPAICALHRDLAGALTAALHCPARATTHIMLCLKACPDEAFEAVLGGDANRDACLQGLREAQRSIDSVAAGGAPPAVSPFPVRIEWLDCPSFAADNPATLSKLLDLACDACRRLMV